MCLIFFNLDIIFFFIVEHEQTVFRSNVYIVLLTPLAICGATCVTYGHMGKWGYATFSHDFLVGCRIQPLRNCSESSLSLENDSCWSEPSADTCTIYIRIVSYFIYYFFQTFDCSKKIIPNLRFRIMHKKIM